ncbi:MAG TPA: ribonuclease domain-containing protein [Mycobacterium sp.]|nr:ribonuclease domain-containing protein [Mycobacterium sp.]
MSRRRAALVALCALIVIGGGWALLRPNWPTPATTTATTGGVRPCPLATLPAQVADTVRAIHSNGPFPFPRSDGAVFGNREGHLPHQSRRFYHEYTVVTLGARDRSMRRIITGGSPLSNPPQYFYTADHYESFCLVTDAGGQR